MITNRANITEIERAAGRWKLQVLGVLPARRADPVPERTKTIVLLGPREPGFWRYVTREPEFLDQQADPLDRWSTRAITGLATSLNATAVFPFSGPPYAPFTSWAVRSGRAWTSPVGLLVHDRAGLMLSYRGALALPDQVAVPEPVQSPCESCLAQPCLSACPVAALSSAGYDLDACHQYLDTGDGQDCMTGGCGVRRACPVSQRYARDPAQSAYHMGMFHR